MSSTTGTAVVIGNNLWGDSKALVIKGNASSAGDTVIAVNGDVEGSFGASIFVGGNVTSN